MAKRHILIYLDNLNPSAEVSWLVLDQRLQAGPVFRGDLKTAANHASGCRAVVIVPGHEILLTNVDIPNMNRQRLMRAVPFALEETIAADVDDMHFASGVRTPDGRLCVATCAHEHLEHWVNVLREANINADVLIPALLGVPGERDRWRVIFESAEIDDNSLVILRQAGCGFSFERKNLGALLRLAIEQCAVDKRPQSIEFVQLNSKLSSDFVLENPTVDADSATVIRTVDDNGDVQEFTQQSKSPSKRGSSLSDFVRINHSGMRFGDNAEHRKSKSIIGQVVAQDHNFTGLEPVGQTDLADNADYTDHFTAHHAVAPSLPEYHQQLNRQMEAVISPEIQALCDEHRIAMEYSSGDFSVLTYIAAQGLLQYDVNLLQGEFSRKEQLERILRPWIPAAAVASIWLVIQVGLFASHYIEMSNKERQLDRRMDQIFAEAFPDAKKTKFHLREMQSRVANLKKEDTVEVGGFIPLLYKAGNVLKDTDEANITDMRFKNDKIDITMEITDLQALDKLKENLINKAQLKVEILTATSRDGKVSSRIQVESQGNT